MANTTKSVTLTEAELITWFSAQVDNLNFKGFDVESLILSYDKNEGFGICLEKGKPQQNKNETQEPA